MMRVNAGRRLPSRAREKGKKEGDAVVAVDPDRWVPAGRERERVNRLLAVRCRGR